MSQECMNLLLLLLLLLRKSKMKSNALYIMFHQINAIICRQSEKLKHMRIHWLKLNIKKRIHALKQISSVMLSEYTQCKTLFKNMNLSIFISSWWLTFASVIEEHSDVFNSMTWNNH